MPLRLFQTAFLAMIVLLAPAAAPAGPVARGFDAGAPPLARGLWKPLAGAFGPPLAQAATVGPAPAGGYVPGEVIVRYRAGTSPSAQDAVEDRAGAEAERELPGGSAKLSLSEGQSVAATVAELRADPRVTYASANHIAHAAAFAPNDPEFPLQWNLAGAFGLGMPEAWDLAALRGAPGGRGAIIAVIDSGVAYERRGRYRRAPDLRRESFRGGYDFVGDDRHPNDAYGHGTHVAGTIAQATHNGYGAAGIAYGARIMPLRVLDAYGDGSSADIARAIRHAVRKRADVINLSMVFLPWVGRRDIPEVIDALRYAHRRGVVIVGAAGNKFQAAVSYPARADSVIAVGATTDRGCKAEYSNEGRALDLAAPGGGYDAPNSDNAWDAAHCRPEGSSRSILSQTFRNVRRVQSFGFPRNYKGTSMASAHVAAVAGLLIASGRLGADPGPRVVERQLEATAVDAGAPGFDRRYGAGLLNAAAALR